MSEIVAKRIETCKACPELNSLKFCKQCGCFMPAKIRIKWSKCPLDKWEKFGFEQEPEPYTGLLPHEEYKLKMGIKDDE